MSYSTALEMRQSALRWAHSPRAADWFYSATSTATGGKFPDEEVRRWADGFQEACRESLGRSEVYYWHPSLCDPIQDAAASAPPITLRSEMLPSEYGFCWFGSPLLDPGEPDPDMTALSWTHTHDGASVIVTPWFRLDEAPAGIPCGHILWEIGGTEGRMLAAPDDLAVDNKSNWLVRLLGSMFLFMEQRVTVTTDTEPDRATRRRLQREGASESLIRVVQLRRAQRETVPHERAGTHPDWSCSWMVRPHWALRWCGPGRQETRPVWIAPYVKGDPSKPLRAAERVFMVAR